jgi:hypothetical protein
MHTTGQPVINLSRRLSHIDGSFAGVVVGGLRLTYFQDVQEYFPRSQRQHNAFGY